jgi:hypothetical protein
MARARSLTYSHAQRGGFGGTKRMSGKGLQTISFLLLVMLTLYVAFGGGA